jgi:hypothetical protein
MKNFTLLLFSLLAGTTILHAQDQPGERDSLYKNADFEIVSAKVLNLNSTAPQTGVLLDFSKRPVIKGAVPFYQGNMSALFAEASVASNNDFIPLFQKGKWAPGVSGNLSYTLFLNRQNTYFDGVSVSKAEYVNASQLFWVWLTTKAGFNVSSYLFYRDNNNDELDKQISRKNYKSLFGQINAGFYYTPFKSSLSWLSLSGNLGFEYRQHDNNYAAMQSVMVRSYNKVTTATGTEALEVTSEETSAKQGEFILANTSIVNYNLTFLISPQGKYAFGLNFFGRTRLTQSLKSTDLGFGVNIPVQRKTDAGSKTVANLSLNYELPDITNQLNQNNRFSDKGLLGLTVAIPIYTLSYNK